MSFFLKRIVNSILDSNSFLIYDPEDKLAWIVDPGDVLDIIEWVKSNEYQILGVLLTHAHFDHIYGLNLLLDSFPDLVVYVGEDDKQALYSPKLNMSKYHDEGEFVYQGSLICSVVEGSVVELFNGVCAEAFSVPGHTPGSMVYRISEYLITGDAYIPGYNVVTLFPRANKCLASASWNFINDMLSSGNFKLYPGHGVCSI